MSTWVTRLANEPARYIATGGGTSYRGQQLEETIVAVFEVRYRAGYSPTERVLFNGETYGITRVMLVDGNFRYLALFCKAVAA